MIANSEDPGRLLHGQDSAGDRARPHIKESSRQAACGSDCPVDTHEAGGARRFCEALGKKGLLCKETHVDTIRFAPPLCITREELDWALDRVVAVFAEID